MASPCGRYVVVFNGEIYNFPELRSELAGQGFGFNGGSDTEVLLAAYRYWGPGCVDRLQGMFAFALWDGGDRGQAPRLFFARDRVGKKPLYLAQQGRSLRFASELKGLQSSWSIDLAALNHYLALGYVPGGRCIAQGVRKLPPAHAGYFAPSTGELSTWRYWSLPAAPEPTGIDPNPAPLVALTKARLAESVRMRLRSDVPVGVLLSGGLDSSLVTAVAAQASCTPLLTFTAAFPGSSLDESAHAQKVASYFGTRHHVLELTAPSLDVLEELGGMVDEPLADSSLIPTFLIARLTARHVKVVLSGDGGDELFGGYPHYQSELADLRRLGWIPTRALRPLADLAGLLPAGIKGRSRLYALRAGAGLSHVWRSSYFDASLRTRILEPDLVQALGPALVEPEGWLADAGEGMEDPVQRMTRTDFRTILADDFLAKVDRASMAVGLEVRCPFLDHRLVELAFNAVPSRLKVHGGQTRILQKALGRTLLPPTLDLERKQGFSIPLDRWLRQSRCRELEDLRPWLPDAIRASEVDRLIRGHLRGRASGARIFCLTMLALACRNGGTRGTGWGA